MIWYPADRYGEGIEASTPGIRRVVTDGKEKKAVWEVWWIADQFPSCCGANVWHQFSFVGRISPKDWELVKQYVGHKLEWRDLFVPIFAITVAEDEVSLGMYGEDILQLYKLVESNGRILYTWTNPGHSTTLNMVLIEEGRYE